MKSLLPALTPRTKSYILFLITTIIWGIAGPVIKFTLDGFPPLVFLVYRFGLAAILGIPIIILARERFPKGKDFWLVIFYSFLSSTVALGLLFFGYEKTTALYGALLSAAGPILIAIGGVLFLREIVTRREMLGTGIAFMGTVITVLGPALRNHDGTEGLIGNLLVFTSLIVGVATAVIGKILLRKNLSPLFLTNFSFVVGFVTIAPVTLAFIPLSTLIEQIKTTTLPYHLGVIYMALASGTLAYWFWHKAQKTIEIGEGGIFGYFYPIISTPLAIFWLGEKITFPFIIGAVIIAVGVIIAEYKKKNI